MAFDVNETLLDLAALDPLFSRLLGRPDGRAAWFGQLVQSALVSTVLGTYVPFGAVGAAALEMVAHRYGVALREEDRQALREGMVELPAHADVRPALARLHEAGGTLAALTNSTLDVAERQLANAGLRDLFHHVLSADTVRRLKPAAEPYQHAAAALAVPIGELWMVAAHAWDIRGAQAAGCRTAYVARGAVGGSRPGPLGPNPDFVCGDLGEVADRLIAYGSGA